MTFVGYLDDGSSGIFTGNGGAVTTIVDDSGVFGMLGPTTINNEGSVVFGASLDTREYGIFTGADPINDKVIAIGDPLFGSTVTRLNFSNGLNNSGQIAFLAELADGTEGVFVAEPEPLEPEPVPEPASVIALLAVGALSLVLQFERQ